ncbi:hypothetical protein ETB97_010342 [Aspergillus alliaceus]|uniref:Uncharacterized protein n=1 Tax=Petromyces alliaceus TaxID=209559 RepID=A0A8H6E0P0_PETAA|nr:hypothetical protein ETB97_010342 [Aspergillus burnettii]
MAIKAQEPSFQEKVSPTELTSTYYFYHEGDEDTLITNTPKPKRKKGQSKKEETESLIEAGTIAYFVHKPYVSFHSPPRTLRRGGSKGMQPICLIQSSFFWKRWRLQFGDRIANAIDPRGVVGWWYRSNFDNTLDDEHAVKGYRVRSWRLWGESGKQYHREVNAQRKEGVFCNANFSEHQPVRAEEAISLTWTSPFSTQTRWYRFGYAGVELCWKGTRSLPDNRKWAKRLMPIHHLKLTANFPGGKPGETVLAQFLCSPESGQCGSLLIFDTKVVKVIQNEKMLLHMDTKQDSGNLLGKFHDIIIATAWCMITGEYQKRKIAIELLFEMAFAGV